MPFDSHITNFTISIRVIRDCVIVKKQLSQPYLLEFRFNDYDVQKSLNPIEDMIVGMVGMSKGIKILKTISKQIYCHPDLLLQT